MAKIAQPAATEALAGLVERVTFHNPENGFCVLRVKARGQRDLITVVGHAAMISAGEFVQLSGAWVNDRTHGQQFRAAFVKASPPTTLEGIERYLASGMIRGIGPVYAKRLVRGFGEAVFDLIEQQPERLREVSGIGAKRAARIIAGWAEQKVIREIMLFLHANGVGTSRAVRIYKTYGNDAVRVISENPYRLARDIRGIGFRTADQIAAKIGIEKTALVRIRAGISYALAEAMNEGHCGLPTEELTTLTARLLEVSADLIATALQLELEAGDVVADLLDGRRCVFLAGLYRAEQSIAERLGVLLSAGPPWPPIDASGAGDVPRQTMKKTGTACAMTEFASCTPPDNSHSTSSKVALRAREGTRANVLRLCRAHAGVVVSGRSCGRKNATPSPTSPKAASAPIAAAYAPWVSPATRIVPAIAVPREEPRFDTLRDNPEISPWRFSGKLDWTMLTDGVSIPPSPNPMRKSPGTKAQVLDDAPTMTMSSAIPPMLRTKPATMSVRWARRRAKRSAPSEDRSRPTVAAVKITPVWMAS